MTQPLTSPHPHAHDWGASPGRAVQGLGRAVGVPGSGADGSPVSMAMHLHAAFSEKTASFEAHLSEARRLGVDVLWWTDHDFRVNAHGYRDAVGFDGLSEDGAVPVQGWEWVEEREGDLGVAEATFVDEPHSPDEPGRAMRLVAGAAGSAPATLWFHGEAANLRYSTCLADTTVELDVFPYALSGSSRLVIEIQSSFHPARAGRPAGRYVVRYELGEGSPSAEPGRSLEGDGLVGVVELTAQAHQWRRLALRPVDDIAALWPDLVAGDNSLVHLRIGARSAGDRADVVVDRLRFHRAEREGRASLDLRRRILEAYVGEFPQVRQYESLEVSLTRHMNWFGGDLMMPRYPGDIVQRDFDPDLAWSVADLIHSNGGLVSWNHPLGKMYQPQTKEDLAAIVVRSNALGCDVVEVGNNPDIDEMLWVFDVACSHGIFFTASGVSDDHTAEDWMDQKHNYLTHVWAPSVELPDVMGALRSGRSWFARAEWRGTFDIEAGGVDAMGGVIMGAGATVPARIIATDLPKDSTLEIVTGTVDSSAGPSTDTTSMAIAAADLPASGYGLDLRTGPTGSYVRAQLRDATGRVAAASNPVWALPESSTVPVPPARVLRPA